MPGSAPTFRPLYSQIKSLIMEGLAGGAWAPGAPIPSEAELARRYKVSQGTVRKAVEELAQEHHLVRRQGRGTFVATHAEERTQFRFLRLCRDDDQPETYPETRLLEWRRARAAGEAARLLNLKPGEGLVVVRRLLVFDGEPAVVDEISLPASIFRRLDAELLNRYRGSLYKLFETEFGTRMIRAEERIRAAAADGATASALGMRRGDPVLRVDRVAFTYADRPVEFRRGMYRTDRRHYRNQLV